MADEAYLIGSGDRALWLGLGPVRVGVLAAGVLAAVTAGYAGTPLLLAAIPLVVAAAWCFTAFGGAPIHELTLAATSYTSRLLTGAARQPAELATSTPRERVSTPPVRLHVPASCGRLALSAIDISGVELGVLSERGRQGWEVTCLLRVTGDAGFSLLDSAEQSRRLAGWGLVLSALAGEYADRCRLQWIETAAPQPHPLEPMSELAASIGAQSLCHRTVLATRVRTGQRDRDLAVRQAEPLYQLLASRLLASELIAEPLDRNALGQQLRLAMTGDSMPASPVTTADVTGPATCAEAWDHLRTDDTWHRGYLVTGWPRVPVGPAWLSPLLTEGPSCGWRSVAMHFQAVRPDLAGRRARAARQSASLDVDDRARLGFGVGARERRTQEETDAVEEELAAGHVQHRVAGLILVSAHSMSDLDDASRQTVATASAARLDVKPLHGRQGLAWAAALPLCRLEHRAKA
jgi:hypothetical protein